MAEIRIIFYVTGQKISSMSSNRELVLKRRDLIRPDLNKQYASLCNPSTPVSSFLFGDKLSKEVELSNKVNPKKRLKPTRFLQVEMCVVVAGLAVVVVVEKPLHFFLGRGRGQTWSQAIINKDSVGSSSKVGQSTVVSIIANQSPFKTGGLQYFLHKWKKIKSDPFILDAVTHCHIEFDCSGYLRHLVVLTDHTTLSLKLKRQLLTTR